MSYMFIVHPVSVAGTSSVIRIEVRTHTPITQISRSCSERLAVFAAGYLHYMGEMKRMFLEKFFPTSIIVTIWKEIYGIRQHSGETFHEYWERFNKFETIGGGGTLKVVSEVSTFGSRRLENQLMELTSLVRKLTVSQHQ
ncbi:hypothetical protein CR513_58784, partial [Mucuna pruriens]